MSASDYPKSFLTSLVAAIAGEMTPIVLLFVFVFTMAILQASTLASTFVLAIGILIGGKLPSASLSLWSFWLLIR